MPRAPRRDRPRRGGRVNPLALLPPAAQADLLDRASSTVKHFMKRGLGIPLGAVFAHGVGMHNPENGVDCHPDPDCPTCRREQRG